MVPVVSAAVFWPQKGPHAPHAVAVKYQRNRDQIEAQMMWLRAQLPRGLG